MSNTTLTLRIFFQNYVFHFITKVSLQNYVFPSKQHFPFKTTFSLKNYVFPLKLHNFSLSKLRNFFQIYVRNIQQCMEKFKYYVKLQMESKNKANLNVHRVQKIFKRLLRLPFLFQRNRVCLRLCHEYEYEHCAKILSVCVCPLQIFSVFFKNKKIAEFRGNMRKRNLSTIHRDR